MKATVQIGLIAAATLLLTSTAMALPSAGQRVTVRDGIGSTSGGEFRLDIGADGVIDYTSFCAEKNEYINIGGTYTIASVEDYAERGGVGGATNGRDYLSDATKWVMYNYITNQGLFFEETRTNSMADEVQNIIWALEEEQTYSSNLYSLVLAQQDYGFDGYTVKVLNLMNGNTFAQSQIIAEALPPSAVPEPTTMLLFGAGMLGLASAARRREK